MTGKLLRMLGLARRAGSLTYGITAVKAELKKANAKLVIFESDLAEGSKEELLKELSTVKAIQIPHTKEEIGYAIGTKPTGILSISVEHFKNGILSNI